MKILIFYSLIMSSSCVTCISTLGFCIIIYFSILWVTSQYYFVLQNLHKGLPSTTLYYKTCTKSFPILLCTTKLAQSTSQYYFLKGILKGNHQRQNEEHVLTNHYRSLDAATPIRFAMSSCKKHQYYACSRGAKQP